MEVAMEVEETESARHERVKELEAIVLQLAKENRKLLTKVTESEGKYREEASSSAARRGGGGGGEKLGNATSTDDLISLDGEVSEANEDEWLFVSPAKPPTPSQKRVTPSQWLERGCVATADDPVFSLDEVRKDLSFQISNAESLSPSSNVRRTPGGGGSPLAARRKLSNPTAQRYLNQVRERRNSPPVELASRSITGLSSPVGGGEGEEGEEVPVVRWRRPVLPRPEPPSHSDTGEWEEEETVPVVRWKKPVLPRPEPHQEDDVPVVRWKKPVVPQDNHSSEEAVPVVRWKKPVVPQTGPQPPPTFSTETVPVVKWKKPALPESDDSPEEETVPTVRWKRPVLPPDNMSEEAPTGGLKTRQQRNIPIKAISTSARSPPEGEEEEVRVHQSNTLPRASARHSLGGGGLKPLAGSPSPQFRQRNASAERASQRQATQTLRSRSPSPGLRYPGSNSPSPTLVHSSRLHARTGRPRPSPSPPRSSLQPPSGAKQNLVKTPSAPGPRKLPTPPSSAGLRGRGLSPSYSTPSAAGSGVTSTQMGLTPPSSGVGRQPRQQQGGLSATPPRAGVPRPRTQQSPQRGGLTPSGTPRSDPGSQIRPVRHTAATPNRQQRNTQKKLVASSEDDWLEGCY